MKRKKSVVDQRRQDILSYLKENPGTNVNHLAAAFQVSVMTMRRDLQNLEDMGMLNRYYGGARVVAANVPVNENGYRELIARYAATLVEPGDSIFLNSSSTALGMVRYLTQSDISVITNNGRAMNMEHPADVQLILTGGEVRRPKNALVGDYALRSLRTVYAKKSFIGCNGISVEMGMTTENANEVSVNALMMEQVTGENYVLADHTKIGKNSSFSSCMIGDVQNLITDELAPEEVLDQMRAKGVKVHIVRRNS